MVLSRVIDQIYSANMKQQEKNQSPVTRAFRAHESALRAFVSRLVMTPSDIDDVTQETFLRAFNAEKAKEIQQPKSFLYTVARNIVLSNFARKSNQLTDYVADFEEFGVIEEREVSDEVEAEETFLQYCGAVAALPEQCRRVYLLRKVYGLTHKEIALRLGLSVSTVEKHLVKGVRRCSDYLREQSKS